jgi:hypothetical protein
MVIGYVKDAGFPINGTGVLFPGEFGQWKN